MSRWCNKWNNWEAKLNFGRNKILRPKRFEPGLFSSGGDNLNLEQRTGKKTLKPKRPYHMKVVTDCSESSELASKWSFFAITSMMENIIIQRFFRLTYKFSVLIYSR